MQFNVMKRIYVRQFTQISTYTTPQGLVVHLALEIQTSTILHSVVNCTPWGVVVQLTLETQTSTILVSSKLYIMWCSCTFNT